jgi:hypothetical protein
MQDCLRLRNEIDELPSMEGLGTVKILPSKERWSPIAAILIKEFCLPPASETDSIDLTIPIPDLYGFASSAQVVIVSQIPIRRNRDLTLRPYPGFFLASEHATKIHTKNYSFLRRYPHRLKDSAALFLTPSWDTDGYLHASLAHFLARLTNYFRDPDAFLEQEISYCWSKSVVSPNPWWFVRMSELYEQLDKPNAASGVRNEARVLFGSHPILVKDDARRPSNQSRSRRRSNIRTK